MYARLISFCSPTSDFQNNVFWDTAGTQYKNVNYFDIRFARPRSDVFQEVNEDSLKRRTVIYQRQRMEIQFSQLIRKELVDYFSRLGLNDTVEIYFFETQETYTITNVRFEDAGEPDDILAVCTFTFDLVATTGTACADGTWTETVCP